MRNQNKISNLTRNAAFDRNGSVGMTYALMFVPMLSMIGAGLDMSMAITSKQKLQSAVDASAIAGARLPATSNDNRLTAAEKMFAVHVTGTQLANVKPTIRATNAGVEVSADFSHPTKIMNIIGFQSINVKAASSAQPQIENGGVACLMALNETSDNGLHLQGINKASARNCWTWVNSASASSINATGASLGTAQGFCTRGGVIGADHFAPAPYTGCQAMEDPFKAKFESMTPGSSTCTAWDVQLGNGNHTLSPGTYCGNTEFKPQANVTLLPGTYVFVNGRLTIQAGAKVTGDGVSFFFRGSNTGMTVKGGADLVIKAPSTGEMAGFAIVDRKWFTSNAIYDSIIQGGGTIKIEGIMYVPQWKLSISGNSEVNQTAKYTALIADTVYMEGNGKLVINSDAAAAGLPDLMPRIKNGPMLLQ